MKGSAAGVRPRTTDQPKQQKIPGGTCAIHPLQCCIIWAAQQEKVISSLAFRVYFAAHEVKYWRAQTAPDGSYHHAPHGFKVSDLSRLLPGTPETKIAKAFAELEATHILTVSDAGVGFAQDLHDLTLPDPVKHRIQNMFAHLHENTRDKCIKMPRRLLKLIVQCGRRIVRAATLIGILLTTMLTKRSAAYEGYKGCCKAEWIASLFGVNAKRVNLERARLIAEGWFRRLPTPQRVRQRYGEWVALNLTPAAPTNPGPGDTSGISKVQPLTPQTPPQLQPPLIEPVAPSEIENNQTLPPRTPSGAYQPRPTWTNIQPDDLRLESRSEALYQETILRNYLNSTPADRINFYAAIAHALRVARHNACGLLRTIVEKGLWHVISQADEYNGITRLKYATHTHTTQETQQGQANSFLRTSTRGDLRGSDQPIELSQDALIVQTVTADLHKAGVTGDVLQMVKRHGYLRDWNRDRWERAEQELAQARLHQACQRYQEMDMIAVGDILEEDSRESDAHGKPTRKWHAVLW
jgi:hypothetical protein